MFRILLSMIMVCGFSTLSLAQDQSTPFNPIAFELSYEAADTSQARRTLLDEALKKVQSSPQPDLLVFFDLNQLLLEELEREGDLPDAANVATQLVQFALRQGSDLGIDPISQLATAKRLAEAAGDYRLLSNLFDLEFNYLLDGGQSNEILATVWDEAADAAERLGETQEAARYRTLGTNLRSKEQTTGTRGVDDEGGFREVDVFYATDRLRTERENPAELYGSGRGELEYGTLRVSIPDTHVPGAIEAPSIWSLEFSENPAKHIILQSVTPLEKSIFYEKMQTVMQLRDRKEAFVFIHGFNVRFEAAAKRAAQLAHDMNYRGVPVLYSWPSVGKTTSYIADTAVVRLSGRRLAEFLRTLKAQSGADVIHIVAHSMGNRALTDALELLSARWTGEGIIEPQFGQIFFAAPDVDAGLFVEMASSIRPFAKRLTLYTSQKDWALVTSRKLHGNAPRAGQGGEVISQAADFDTVDMSDLGEDMLAHSYFANDSSALVDIMALLWRNTEPSGRCGVEPEQAIGTNTSKNWVYRKGQCDVSRIMGLIATAWEQPRVDFPKIRKLIARYANDPNEMQKLERTFSSILGDE